jgi:hypothetical protein
MLTRAYRDYIVSVKQGNAYNVLSLLAELKGLTRLTRLTLLTPRPTLQAARGRDSTLCLLALLRLLARGYASLCMAERTGCPILLSL